jgi:hypothetical protein
LGTSKKQGFLSIYRGRCNIGHMIAAPFDPRGPGHLLNLSRDFYLPHKSIKSWFGRTHHIWQEFEPNTLPTFKILKVLLEPSVKTSILEHTNSVLDVFYNKIISRKFPTTMYSS